MFTNLATQFGPLTFIFFIYSTFIFALIIERSLYFFRLPRFSHKQQMLIVHFLSEKNQNSLLQNQPKLAKFITFLKDTCIMNSILREQRWNLYLLEERHILQRNLFYLQFGIVGMPMIGLLGTIISLSHSFSALTASANQGISGVAFYLAKAMWSTGFGIFLAIVCLIANQILRESLERYLAAVEIFLNHLQLLLIAKINKSQ